MRFGTINIIYLILLILGITVQVLSTVNLPFIIVLVVFYVYSIAWGAMTISSGMFLKAYCNVLVPITHPMNPNKWLVSNENEIALTFDDGPHPENTAKILDILAKYNIKATFFLIGENVEKYPDLVRRISNEGHSIGNHSYYQKSNFGFLSAKKVKEALLNTEKTIETIIGKKTKLFRPPYGVTNPNIAKAVRELEYKTIGWSLRSYDTKAKQPEKLLAKLKKKMKKGDIILLHDYSNSTVNILEKFLAFAKENNFKFVNIDDRGIF